MARELSYQQSVIRSLIKTYRKSIWNSFVEGCKNYKLVCNNDKIAVYVENDACSVLCALLLIHLQRISDVEFELEFIGDCELLEQLEIKTLNANSLDSACFVAISRKCNKLAVSTNLNDVINYTIYNLFYNSSVSSILPKENIEDLQIIRPLFCIYENDIEKWKCYNNINLETNMNSNKAVDELVKQIKKINPDFEHNIFTAVQNVKLDTVIAYKSNGEVHSFLDKF